MSGPCTAALQKSEWFQTLPAIVRHEMLKEGKVLELAPRRTVYLKGDPALSIYLILFGHLRTGTTSFCGRQLALSVLDPGDVFGTVEFFEGDSRLYDVCSLTPAALLSVPYPVIRRLLDQFPELYRAFAALVSKQYNLVAQTFVARNSRDLASRTAMSLVSLATTHGIPCVSGHRRIALPLSQTELSHFVGCSRQRLNTTLKKLERQRFITISKAGIAVADEAALRRVAGFEA